MMSKTELYNEYCTGCGLCQSCANVKGNYDSKGYFSPALNNSAITFCENYCMASGKALEKIYDADIWGKTIQAFLGWAKKSDVRYNASSGGVLTMLCIYLLENKLVDAIIQTKADSLIPYATETKVSRTVEDVLACMGSRYSISSPLANIKEMVCKNESYAFVGKPCDVAALRLYLQDDKEMAGQIKFLFSFFCAGLPSNVAQKKLLQQLGCTDENPCEKLQYRGNGWPGFATATRMDGTKQFISYDDSWGKILGRDIRKCCRICVDGVGEAADIACGDAWYMTADKKPDFREAEGRNVIFARTEIGDWLLKQAASKGYIQLEDYNPDGDLLYIQNYQYMRRATMLSMLLAMKLLGKCIPYYSFTKLSLWSKQIGIKQRLKRFLGTIKRTLEGKM